MSNKTQLQTNNTTLDGYIARINAAKEVAASLPEAGGSANIETCTVTINSVGQIPRILAIKYENGQIITYEEKSGIYNNTVTISNVVKGSIISFRSNAFIIPAHSAANGVTSNGPPFTSALEGTWSFTIAPTVSDNVIISVWDDD